MTDFTTTPIVPGDDAKHRRRRQIIVYVIHMIYTDYLRVSERMWTWHHIMQQAEKFMAEQPMTKYDGYDEYTYNPFTFDELKDALLHEANIFPAHDWLDIEPLVDRFPGYFQGK